jgi:hypothetical protein
MNAIDPTTCPPLVLEGLLVQGEHERVRIVLEGVVIEVDLADVLDVETFTPPADLREGAALLARVVLVHGARLRGLASSEPYRELLWREPLPFAMATRPDRAEFVVPEDYVALERRFLAEHGLGEGSR